MLYLTSQPFLLGLLEEELFFKRFQGSLHEQFYLELIARGFTLPKRRKKTTEKPPPEKSPKTGNSFKNPPYSGPSHNHLAILGDSSDDMGTYNLLPKLSMCTDAQNYADLYQTWVSAAAITDAKQQKRNFALGLDTSEGRMWASLSKDLINDATTTLDGFIVSFLQQFSRQQGQQKQEFLSCNQGPREPAMSFIIKMRYQFKIHMKSLDEKEQVEFAILKMQIPAQNFIMARGKPDTWEKLIEIIREYEESLPSLPSIPTPSTSSTTVEVNQLTGDPMQLLMKHVGDLSLEVKQLRGRPRGPHHNSNNNRGSSRGRGYSRGRRGNNRNFNNNVSRSSVDCYSCGRRGHIARDCRSSNRGSRGSRGSRGFYPNQGYPPTVQANGRNFALVPVQQPENCRGLTTPTITMVEE